MSIIIEAKDLIFESNSPINFKLEEGKLGVILDKDLANKIGCFIFGKGKKISGDLNYADSIQFSEHHMSWKQNIGFCFRGHGVLAAQSIYENVNLPVKYYNQDQGLTSQALEDIGIPKEYWELRPHLTNDDIRKKVLLARSAVLNPKFIFLDDPMAMLANTSKSELHQWIIKQKEKGISLLMGTDDVHAALIYGDWILDEEKFTETNHKIANLLKEEYLKEI